MALASTISIRRGAGGDARSIRSRLLRWYSREARDLPWRVSRDPYRVWISEVMLQQTRVEAVVEPFERFLRAFPSLEALAAAGEGDVLAAWSGLGYYRRARLLHAGARHLVETHGGSFPASRDVLRSVPGIGDYTSAAILALAFGRREAAIDANVSRVVSRVAGIVDPRTSHARRAVAAFAGALVDCARPGDVNEALMDLGSAVCTQRIARCEACPLSAACAAFASGTPLAFAQAKPRKMPRDVRLACAVLRSGDCVLLVRRADEDALLAGLWDLPSVEAGAAADERTMLEREVLRRSGRRVRLQGPVASVRHDIVGRRIVAAVYEAQLARGRDAKLPEDARWTDADVRAGLALPALPVKILRSIAREAKPRSSAARAAG